MIKPLGEATLEVLNEIDSYQAKDKLIINAGLVEFDLLTPGSVITIAGPSFMGKTFYLNKLKKNIMSKWYNRKANNFVWLSNSLEMTNLMNTLRDLSLKLNKSKKEILTNTFSEEDKILVNEYYKDISDGRFFVNETPPTPEEFEESCIEFLELHKDKDLVGIDYDHTGLTRGSNKKAVMDSIYESQNKLKKLYPNVLFVDINQFNRDSLTRIIEKDESMKPRRSDLANSDNLFQVSDVVICLSIPYKSGVEQYRLVSPYFYDYLADHFGEFNTKRTKVSFQTFGRIFIEKLKDRFTEGINPRDTFIEIIEEDTRPIEERKPKEREPKFKEEKNIIVNFKEE